MNPFFSAPRPDAVETVCKMPGLVAFWTFGEAAGTPRQSVGTTQKHTLLEVGGPIVRVDGGPFSGFSAHLAGTQYFRMGHGQLGNLDIGGVNAAVSMFAVVKMDDMSRGTTIAGVWSEGKGANNDSGTRQYAMLLNMPTYGGFKQLTPHISSEGGVSRRADGTGMPWCADYAASVSEVPVGQWVTLGFTYDGQFIRAYFNGLMEARTVDPIKDKRTDPYFTKEGAGGKHRGINPYYHGRGIFKYDPVRHAQTKPDGGSDFTVGARYAVGSMLKEALKGRIGGLVVFDRSLHDADMKNFTKPQISPRSGNGSLPPCHGQKNGVKIVVAQAVIDKIEERDQTEYLVNQVVGRVMEMQKREAALKTKAAEEAEASNLGESSRNKVGTGNDTELAGD